MYRENKGEECWGEEGVGKGRENRGIMLIHIFVKVFIF